MSKELQVEQLILNEILSEELKAGEMMLPERDLAIKYDCSRPVVHKAIIRLENKGVLKIRPRKGIEVLDFKISGKLSLIEVISQKRKDSLSRKLNHDMLFFIKDNFKNVIQSFQWVDKKPTPIILKEPEDFFNLLFDYGFQSNNSIYPMLINEFKIGILNVANCCSDSKDVGQMFHEIEKNIMEKQTEEAIAIVDGLFELIENLWLGGSDV